MSQPPKKGTKWIDPPEGYKLKSDVGALCAAAVKEFEGKSFGQFYVTFCRDTGKRADQYGEKIFLTPKQAAILAKLEINKWPDGVQKAAKTEKPPLDKDFDEFPATPF